MGYGSIRTISDANVRNCKSDIAELRPTVMYVQYVHCSITVFYFVLLVSLSLSHPPLIPPCRAGVPTVWEMIRKSALAKVDAASAVQRAIFKAALAVKTTYVTSGGIPIVHMLLAKFFDLLVFRKFHTLGTSCCCV